MADESDFERRRLQDALRDATPQFLKDGRGLSGPGRPKRPAPEFPPGQVNREPRQPFFPEVEPPPSVQVLGGGAVPDITFILSDATVTEGDPPVVSNKVLVADGKINGTFPSGMGFGPYILDLDDPADSLIYAGVTFNPTTLAITSRFLGVSSSMDYPLSFVQSATNGFLYWLLGFTYFNDDDAFRVVNVRVGDINFAFTYGAQNGIASLLAVPLDSGPGWMSLSALFP